MIIDDMLESEQIRRGAPCWYTVNNQGIFVIKDSFMLENAIYFIIRKYFRYDSFYADILDSFHDIALKTSFGQSLFKGNTTPPSMSQYLQELSLERYKLIVKNKISFFRFYLPIYLAFIMVTLYTLFTIVFKQSSVLNHFNLNVNGG